MTVIPGLVTRADVLGIVEVRTVAIFVVGRLLCTLQIESYGEKEIHKRT